MPLTLCAVEHSEAELFALAGKLGGALSDEGIRAYGSSVLPGLIGLAINEREDPEHVLRTARKLGEEIAPGVDFYISPSEDEIEAAIHNYVADPMDWGSDLQPTTDD